MEDPPANAQYGFRFFNLYYTIQTLFKHKCNVNKFYVNYYKLKGCLYS